MRSDAKWYVDRTSSPVQEFYDIFFRFAENTMSLGAMHLRKKKRLSKKSRE